MNEKKLQLNLQTADIRPGKRLADGQCKEFLPIENLGNNSGLELGRAVIEYWGNSYHCTVQQPIDEPTRSEASEFCVDDELEEGVNPTSSGSK